ncbi:MAG TPA: GvpL/GvpF family gas vesicle protein [Pyrinomonadaceae bacterium]|nr:GvpL/GvpF family gas vesicle protein [Pyrinomonadaceae bacterium]
MSNRSATKNPPAKAAPPEAPAKAERAARPKRAAKAGRGARGFYLYCLGAADALAPLFDAALPEAIEDSARLELVAAGGLAAVASEVPLADYGEEALPQRLADPAWTAARALRHERVVQHFARRAAAVPLRFGTIFLRRGSIERMLCDESEAVRARLELVGGRDEWGVNLYVSRAELREGVARTSPVLREMAERAAALPPGQAYLLRKKIEALRDTEAREEKKRIVSEVLDRLGRVCAASGRLRAPANETTEHGELAARLVFLVGRDGFGEFRAEAERAAGEHASLGFRFELTGPWPAYNFVGPGGASGQEDTAG